MKVRGGAALLAICAVAMAAAVTPAGAASPADWLYEPTTFTEIDLTLPPASVQTLEEHPEDEYVPGTFSIAETSGTPGSADPFSTPIEVGIRLKGGLGSFQDLQHKAAFKIKFDSVLKGQTFDGLQKMTLNNMVQDPSMVHEALAYQSFGALGVPAPRVGYSYLRINGESFGLHLNIETQDKIALEKQLGPFLSPPQHLYEGESGADVTPARWEELEVDEGKKKNPGDKADLEALVAAVAATGQPFSTRVEGHADLDEMTRMWAIEKYIGHWDGYSGLSIGGELPNNYYLYSDAAGVFQMLPWGTDQTWSDQLPFESDGGVLFNQCKGETGAGGCRALYRCALGGALSGLAALDLDQLAAGTAADLHPWQQLEQAQSKPERLPYTQQEIDEGVSHAREFIAERPADLTTFLDGATPAAAPCPPPKREPPPVTPPASTPTPTPPPPAVADNDPVLGGLRATRRALRVRVFAPVAGAVDVGGLIETKAGPVRACSGQADAAAPGTVLVSCHLTSTARRRLERRWLRIDLSATLTPAGGAIGSDSRSIRLRRQPAARAHAEP